MRDENQLKLVAQKSLKKSGKIRKNICNRFQAKYKLFIYQNKERLNGDRTSRD
jgi:hypothetical protein